MSSNAMIPGDGLGLDNPNEQVEQDGPVECLGKTFDSDNERREYYLKILAEKLKDPGFRKIEGFPLGEDEDILELSDPPYYTACPNPFMEEVITYFGRLYDPEEDYKREPYAADVSEGKNDPIYNAHSYHTKVPHKAIMRYILHYTNPGDIVFDGFCGTGMTGVAAQMCGDKGVVESLGYIVLPNDDVLEKGENGNNRLVSKLGVRHAVLSDLSPAATFISANYNIPVSPQAFTEEANTILSEIEEELGWMYETLHHDGQVGKINYTVWSDVFSCGECGSDVVFWDNAVDVENGKVRDEFSCPSCSSTITKKGMERVFETLFDDRLGESIRQAKQVPVRINYTIGRKRLDKRPDEFDLSNVDKINGIAIKDWYPINRLMEGRETRRNDKIGITHAHHFYTKRNLTVLSRLREKILTSKMSSQLLCILGDQLPRASKMHKIAVSRLNTNLSKTAGILAGTLYVPSNQIEYCVISMIGFRIKDIASYLGKRDCNTYQFINTGSSEQFRMPDNCLDYIFLDPPFGANLNYSELNHLWESWLKIWTKVENEAIENSAHKKSLDDYRSLMASCFKEAYRLLKPGRWMTVEFSNTKASVWNSIQTALVDAGFIVANVSALDKKQHTIKVVTSSTAVKQDLIISVYKPNEGFENRFSVESDEDGIWDFVRTHLSYLPVVKKQAGELVKIPERDPRIIFDQSVSYFVRNLRDIPVSSKGFQEGLLERFPERDGMVFLPEQVSEYDKARISNKQLKQLSIFVDDEASAIEWLRQLLNEKPQANQDIHPLFISELSGWKKAEEQLELSKLLEQNFLQYNGEGPVPTQINNYLTKNWHELRNVGRESDELKDKAKNRWYVPNPDREEDLQKLRDRDLLKQFDEYKNHEGRKIKKVRMEAVRCGFKKAWQDRDYKTIIMVAEKIPQNLLQEDQKLLMWYDQAQTRVSDESLF